MSGPGPELAGHGLQGHQFIAVDDGGTRLARRSVFDVSRVSAACDQMANDSAFCSSSDGRILAPSSIIKCFEGLTGTSITVL
jgi:hypothetical protein